MFWVFEGSEEFEMDEILLNDLRQSPELSESSIDRTISSHSNDSESYKSKRYDDRALGTIVSHSRFQWNIWRGVCGVMGFFFLLAAYVQHNDPDPFIWMTAYLVPCFVSWTIAATTYWKSKSRNPVVCQWMYFNIDTVILCHIIYCYFLGGWTLMYFYLSHTNQTSVLDQFGLKSDLSERNMELEEAKELIGLCLVIAWLSLIKNRNFIHFGRAAIILGIVLTIFPFLAWIAVGIYEADGPESC